MSLSRWIPLLWWARPALSFLIWPCLCHAFSPKPVLCGLWFLPGQNSLPLSSPSVEAFFPLNLQWHLLHLKAFTFPTASPTVGSVRAGSTQESSKYLAQPSGTQEILESMKRWVSEGCAHLPQPVLSVRIWGWDPFVPLSILQITILLSICQCLSFWGPCYLVKTHYPITSAAVLTSISLSLRLCSGSCLSAMPSLSDFSVHKDDAPSTLAFWFLDLWLPVTLIFTFLHLSVLLIHPETHCHLEDVMSSIFFPHRYPQKRTFRVHENVLYAFISNASSPRCTLTQSNQHLYNQESRLSIIHLS